MKSNFKRATLLLTGIMVSGKLLAQTPDAAGSSKDYVKPFSDGSAFRTWSIGVNAGLLTPYTIFRGGQDFNKSVSELGYGVTIKDQILSSFGLQASFLKGKVSGSGSNGGFPFDSYKTDLKYAIDLSANFTLANISWRHKKGVIQPYLTAGSGYSAYTPVLYTTDGTARVFKDNSESVKAFYIPVGLGFKINLSDAINLDLGYQINFVDGDNLDGYNYGPRNDRFSYVHAGLEFALGSHSKPQLATHNPVNSMRTEYLMEEQRLQMQVDAQKAQNDQLRNDLNATNANLAKLTADSDGDGVADMYDKCPNTPSGTKVDGSGCPLPVVAKQQDVKVYVTEEDKKVVREAIRNLEFDFGKATIRAHSYPSLDRVAELLVNKNFSLKLAGHTDNVGSDAANLKLSKERAESVKAYLVSKGANASRIEATGYGESQPIASNKTAKGRQANRRVEFSLF